MLLSTSLAAASLLATAQAHIALWNKGMYGYNHPYQASDATQNYNNNDPVTPLKEVDALTVEQWFGHGFKGFPPRAGDFMELPSGGVFTGELGCNRAETTMRDPIRTDSLFQYACSGADGVGALHTMNKYFEPADPKWFGGTSLGIAYTSDINSVSPNDMTIISVNQASVWEREISYAIPAGLPPCPPEGCICSWNWIHRANNGEGYPFEIYNLLYRCRVTGQTNSGNVVRRGAVPRDCTGNPSNCVSGPKTGLYLYQRTGNNLPHLDTPPSYSNEWGFSNGAQNDVFAAASNPAPTTYIINPRATPTNGVPSDNPLPTATALPQSWQAVGCVTDEGDPRILSTRLYIAQNNTISMCVGQADAAGYKYAAVEYGEECWAGNSTVIHTAPESECNVRCAGDEWAFCGGGWRAHLFQKVVAPAQATATSSLPPSTPTTASATTSPGTTSPAAPPTVSPTTTSPAATTTPGTTTPATTSPAATTTTSSTTSPPVTNATPTPAPPPLVIPSGWQALGCHNDGTGFRSINGTSFTNQAMTVPMCINYCGERGYALAALHWASGCFCGNTMTNAPTTGCDSPCSGAGNQICGAMGKLTVYRNRRAAQDLISTPTVTVTVTATVYPTTCPTSGPRRRGIDWS